MGKNTFGRAPAQVQLDELTGMLIVIEGPDASGRSTHVHMLAEWLEQQGYPVARTGLTRSVLVSNELEAAKLGNVLSPRTRALFYATDFYDQLENVIVPALRAGSIVLADRYIYTLMVRDLVRGADQAWLESLYSMAVVPDLVIHFSVTQDVLAERTLASRRKLDYWESGMDLGLSRDWFTSFVEYQARMAEQFEIMRDRYDIEEIDANGRIADIQVALRHRIADLLRDTFPDETPPVVSEVPKKAVRRRAPVRGLGAAKAERELQQ